MKGWNRPLVQEIGLLAGKSSRQEVWRPKDKAPPYVFPVRPYWSPWSRPLGNDAAKLYTDEKCNGCGLCQEVCPSGAHRNEFWKTSGRLRFPAGSASPCLNYCPVQSVQLKGFTERNERYPHPYASAAEIGAQKVGGI